MSRNYLITGGAGFIGTNYVHRLLLRGDSVTVFDNLSRKGAQFNLQWLRQCHGEDSFHLVVGDVRDAECIRSAVSNADVIIHLAGQVAVTSSVSDPSNDFENNALGTFNVLEAARLSGNQPIVIYTSTNKVYGGMENVRVEEEETSYRYIDFPLGISEERPLDFHSPYGCSKGCGDQYVHDYFRIYGLPTVVLRQSCIYGQRQFGVEDQGWVAWFIIATITGKPIKIYGDGKQVRDALFIDDLLDAYDQSVRKIDVAAGQIFNIGGGQSNTISVWKEFGPLLEKLSGKAIPVTWGDWRPGDQRIYISNITKASQVLDWKPKIGVEEGIRRLYQWVSENKSLFA